MLFVDNDTVNLLDVLGLNAWEIKRIEGTNKCSVEEDVGNKLTAYGKKLLSKEDYYIPGLRGMQNPKSWTAEISGLIKLLNKKAEMVEKLAEHYSTLQGLEWLWIRKIIQHGYQKCTCTEQCESGETAYSWNCDEVVKTIKTVEWTGGEKYRPISKEDSIKNIKNSIIDIIKGLKKYAK